MPIKGKYFPSQNSDEKVFLLLRRHWFTYIIFIFISITMAIPFVIVVVLYFTNHSLFEGIVGNFAIIVGTLYFLFILALLLYGFIDYYLDVYIVTDERIVDVEQNGMFKRGISELHLYQVQDVKARVKGAFATFLHYGDIYIQTAAEKENFVFRSIPNPYRVSKMIADLHQAQIDDIGNDKLSQKGGHVSNKENVEERLEDKLTHEDDIGLLGKQTFKKARKSTKELLKEPDVDVDLEKTLENDTEPEVQDKLVDRSNNSLEKNPKEIHNNEKAKDRGSENLENEVESSTAETKKVEMHENEEIDI